MLHLPIHFLSLIIRIRVAGVWLHAQKINLPINEVFIVASVTHTVHQEPHVFDKDQHRLDLNWAAVISLSEK